MIRPVTPNDGHPGRMLPGTEWNAGATVNPPDISRRGLEMLRVLNDILDDGNQSASQRPAAACANCG